MASDLHVMPLTRAQLLATACVLVLANGETIAQQAAEAAGGPKGAPKKVATPKGAQHFHEGIGALIIPHLHYVHGQPGHMIPNISEAKWIAGQWKDKDAAADAAEKAVAAGTHHWVQAGDTSYAVHKALDVHIPKDVDQGDEAAVKNATKVIVKHGEHPEHLTLTPDKAYEPAPATPTSDQILDQAYKKLPAQPAKKAVTFEGKHAAWVPHDWQVYKSKDAAESGDESHLGGKFAKDAAGTWHFIGKNGEIDKGPSGEPEKWAASGSIVPDTEHHAPEPEHVAPNQGAKGPEPAKAEIGGVAVTKDEIQDALNKLQGSPSTQIKGLLKGHPLAASDYHSVYKGELEKYPELKVPSGTKKQHVPEAKNAFIHHLAGHVAKMAADEAHAKAAQEAAAKAEAAAGHAQELTPATVDVGGVPATKEHIADAIGHLEATKSTAIKQILKAKGNPLADSDYWKVIKEHQAAHPAELEKGTKQAHAPNAKTAFIAALHEHAAKLGAEDQASGHDTAAQLDQIITAPGAHVKPGWGSQADGAIAAALVKAHKMGTPVYAWLAAPGEWAATMSTAPKDKASIKATPEHVATMVLAGGQEDHDFTPEHVLEIAQQWITAKPEAGPEPSVKPAAPEPPAPEPPVLSPQALAAWKASPEYQVIDDLIKNHPPGLPPHDNPLDTGQQLAATMYLAAKFHGTRYLYPAANGNWTVGSKVPSGITGTFGMPGKPWYSVDKDHQITVYDMHSQPVLLSGEQVAEIAKQWLTPEEPAKPEPAAAGPGIPVIVGGEQKAMVPAGSKLYKLVDAQTEAAKASVYVSFPDGHWAWYGLKNQISYENKAQWQHLDEMAQDGALTEAAAPEPAAGEAGQLISVAGNAFSAGSKVYKYPADEWPKLVKTPAGQWHKVFADGWTEKAHPALPDLYDKMIEKSKLVAAGEQPPAEPEPEKPSGTVTIWVAGMKAGEVPAGSEVYTGTKALNPVTAVKYIKQPDGSWVHFDTIGSGAATYKQTAPAGSTLASAWQQMLDNGQFQTVSPEQLAAGEKPPEPAAPAGELVTVEAGGTIYQAPAGSTIYVWNKDKAPMAGDLTPDKLKYVEEPSGAWKVIQTGGVTAISPAKGAVTDGKLIPWTEPPAETQDLKKFLVNGAVAPSTQMSEGKANEDWVLVTTLQKAAKTGAAKWAVKQASGAWNSVNYPPYADQEYYHVTPDLTVTHHSGGGEPVNTPVPLEKVSELAHQLVTPDAVKIQVNGEFKVLKHGFYYKPSKTAKSYLEIGPPAPGSNNSATYTYHAPSGSKDVNASYASKVLTDATEYHAEQKGAAPVALKVTHATVVQPGSYQSWSDVTKAPAQNYVIEVFSDGSMNVGTPGSLYPIPATSHPVDGLIKGGSVLDQYGTSVVKPGVATAAYHIFGSEARTPEQVKELLAQFEHASGLGGYSKLMASTFAGDMADRALAFFGDKAAADSWQGQRDAIMALLRELIQIPGQNAGPAAEPVFLKSLPPGIHSAKDVFTWTDQGYAKPADLTLAYGLDSLTYANATLLSDYIKTVSDQFGGGKVVGTHISGLSKDQKSAWLQAWFAGDMTKVFALDSAGGKVSPAHPGAPGNASTHHITWAPWDPSQIPASQVIEGAWSPDGVLPPKAEVDNYLIKAGLQHAAFLSAKDRRDWMKAHRAHDQLTVDKLTKKAADGFSSGAPAQTEPPVWTDNLGPAKAYDAYLDEKTPAGQWPLQAAKDFIAGNTELLQPFAVQAAQAMYGDTDGQFMVSHYPAKVIDKYLEGLAAKELAEKLKPKYSLMPGEPGLATDQYGHHYWWNAGAAAEQASRLAVWGLARAWGVQVPKVQPVTLEDGTPGTITDIVPATAATLAWLPAGISGLTDQELGAVAAGHVFDYAIGNPSSTPGEYVRAGGSITGTGKAGAFTDFGWDGASLAGLNAVTVQPVSQLFDAIASGELSQAQAGAAYIAAVRAARRIAATSSARLTAILAGSPLSPADQAQLAARVQTLPGAIQALWGQVYAKQGWTLPEVPQAQLDHGLHSGFSEPDFFDHVMAAKASGVPAFFAGPSLEDGSFLTWTETAGDNRYLRGESSLRGTALDNALTWAKAHQTGAPAVAAPGGGVKNVTAWHQTVIEAAKAVSRHAADQMWEGPKTTAALQAMADLKTRLTDLTGFADNAIASSDSKIKAGFDNLYGPPDQVRSAAQYYLDKIAQVEQRKANAGTFQPGDIPSWTPLPSKAPEAGPVKVEYVRATRVLNKAQLFESSTPSGSLLGPDGELQLGDAIYEYPGYVYQITLPTGEMIEINDSGETSSPKGQYGRVRFRAIASDGSVSLERIRAQLQEMGVPLEEATPQDMELLYWRHLAYTLANRADRKDGKYAQVWISLTNDVPAAAKVQLASNDEAAIVDAVIGAQLDPAAELAIWRRAWATLTSEQQVQDWVNSDGFYPHLSHLNTFSAETPSGRPYWYRFDASPQWLAGRQLVGHSLSDSGKAPGWIAETGGLYSTEARLRALGTWISGASSAEDMQTYGSAGFVYTRLNQENDGHNHSVLISPRVLARTSTYGFSSDNYGEIDHRKTGAYFDLAKASAWSGGSNETEIKDSISLLDDIMLLKAGSDRQQIIDALKARGITQIRGLPVEDRIVASITPEAIAKAKAAEPDPATWFAQPEDQYAAPSAAPVSAGQSIVQSEAEKELSHAEALKSARYVAAAPAAEPEQVSEVFYQAPAKPSSSVITADAPKLKYAVAQRIAGKMASTDEQVAALAQAAGLQAPESWGETPRIRTVAALIGSWAQSNSSPVALALQNTAHKLFGIEKEALGGLGYASASSEEAAAALENGYGTVLEDFLRTQWAETQAELAAGNLNALTLYRVFHFNGAVPGWAKSVSAGDVIEAPQARPLSSWAFLQSAAEQAGTFASGGKTVVVKATVPASAILGFPRTGFGSYNEAEFVVLDMAGQWEVVKVQ